MWLKGHSRSIPKVAWVNHSSAYWCIFIMTCILHPQRYSFFVTAMTNFPCLFGNLFQPPCREWRMMITRSGFTFTFCDSWARTHTHTNAHMQTTWNDYFGEDKETWEEDITRKTVHARFATNFKLLFGSRKSGQIVRPKKYVDPWAFTRTLGRMLHPFDNISLSWCCLCPGSPKNTKLKNSSTDITYNRVPSYFQKKDVICLSHGDVTSLSPQLLLQLRLLGDEGFYLLVDGFWTQI